MKPVKTGSAYGTQTVGWNRSFREKARSLCPPYPKDVESSHFTRWIGDAGERTARDFVSVSRKYLGEHYRLSARLVGSVKVVRGAKLTILHAEQLRLRQSKKTSRAR